MIVDPARPLLYLSDYAANSIVVINTTNNKQVKSIPVGSGPEGLDISADASELYVALSTANALAVLNLNTLTLSSTIQLSARAASVAAGRLGRAYVTTYEYNGYPKIVDTQKNRVIGDITAAGGIYTAALARISPDRQTLYIATRGLTPETLYKLNVMTDKVTLLGSTSSVGGNLGDMAVSSNGLRLYVASADRDHVQVVNTTDWSQLGALQSGEYPNSVSLTQAGVVFATHEMNDVVAFNAATFLSTGSFPTSRQALMVRAVNASLIYVITFYFGKYLEVISPPHWSAGSYLHVYWITETSVSLNWTGAVDNVGVVGYRLYVNGSLYVSLGNITQGYNVTGLYPNTHYTFKVEAGDGSGDWSIDGPSASATTLRDTTPPYAPTLLSPTDASVTGDPRPVFSWSNVNDPSGVTYSLQVSNNSAFSPLLVNVTRLGYTNYLGSLSFADGVYSWRVRAVDGAGNIGSYSSIFTFTLNTSIPPNPGSYRYGLLYNLKYTRPSPGSTMKMVSIFNNTGNVVEQITGITLTFDFGTYSATSGLPLIVHIGQSTELNMSIIIPASVSPGSHTITASISFQYLEPNSTQWVTPTLSPLVASGTVTIASNPAGNPAEDSAAVLAVTDLIIVETAALAVLLVAIVRITRRTTPYTTPPTTPSLTAIPSLQPTTPAPPQLQVIPGAREVKIDLIPRIIISGSTGPKQYGLLLTNNRSILVLEKKPSGASLVGGALGGAVGALAGAALDQALTSKRRIDYETATPDALAADEKNIAIPHSSIRAIQMKKGFWKAPSRLIVTYERTDGKLKKLKAILEPPRDLIKQRKSEGPGLKQIRLEYANKVQEAYSRALPPTVAATARW